MMLGLNFIGLSYLGRGFVIASWSAVGVCGLLLSLAVGDWRGGVGGEGHLEIDCCGELFGDM